MIDRLDAAEHFAKMSAPGHEILAAHAECDDGTGWLRRSFKQGNRDGALRVAQEQWPVLRCPMLKLADSGESKNAAVPRLGAGTIGCVHVDVIDGFEFQHIRFVERSFCFLVR